MISSLDLRTAEEIYANAKRLQGVFYPSRQIAPTRVAAASEVASGDVETPVLDSGSCDISAEPVREVVAVMPVPTVEDIIASFRLFHSTEERNFPTLRELLLKVSETFGIPLNELKSQRKALPLVNARHAFFWLARGLTDRSFPAIGLYCGGRDHTTVIHGVRRCEKIMQEDESYWVLVNAVSSHFGGAA